MIGNESGLSSYQFLNMRAGERKGLFRKKDVQSLVGIMEIDDILKIMHVYTGIVSGKKRKRRATLFHKLCIPIRDIQYGNKG